MIEVSVETRGLKVTGCSALGSNFGSLVAMVKGLEVVKILSVLVVF